jgi:hypothetical protein
MSSFPASPRLIKGAIVSVGLTSPLPTVVVFQYNPDTLTRALEPQLAGGDEGGRAEALRFSGAPVETISLEAEIDATDQLETGNAAATALGIHPQLAALEILTYPSSATAIANAVLLATGTIEIIPTAAPLTLFIWGAQRVLPVRIGSFNITEESFDAQLNPIRARVSLSLRVLSYNDLLPTNPGYHLYLAHQVAKEAMAALGTVGNLSAVGAPTNLHICGRRVRAHQPLLQPGDRDPDHGRRARRRL